MMVLSTRHQRQFQLCLMRHILMVFVLSCTLAVGARASVTASRITTRETNTCEGRKTPGPICESCELLATCVLHSNGWVNIPVENCDVENGYYCNSRLGTCSNRTGACHPFGFEGNFPCTSHGVFPDVYDCQKYHMCYFVASTLVSATVDCGTDKAFNAASGQCSLSLEDSVCQEKQFECLKAGDAHAWPSNPNIFYICKATSNQDERLLYPTLYRCNDAEIFDGYYCRSAQSGGVPSFPTQPTNPGQTTTTTTTTTRTPTTSINTSQTTTVNPAFRCPEVGLQPDVENCRKYYYCSQINGMLRHLECPPGTVYNSPLSSCTLGHC